MDYYNIKEEELFKGLNSSKDGLTASEARDRLMEIGPNKIEEAKGKSHLRRFIEQFNDLMIIILIIVAILMLIYGIFYTHDYTDTIVITIVVLLNAIMGFIQEEKAEVTLNDLKKYSTTSCKVKRNGSFTVIDAQDLVPGDVILLEAGDKIPADARLLSEANIKVDESPLTGESLPIKKMVKSLSGKRILQEQVNMLFCGCHVVNGTCEALVVKTGMNTELGKIALSLNTPYEVTTPLQIKMQEISRNLTIMIFVIIMFMFFYGVANNYKIIEIIMLCVSLAVAAIPEGLPAVITIALSSGTAALAKKRTIVRQMSAVETLGSMEVICSDKTGTITQNKMTVKEVISPDEHMMDLTMLLANDAMVEGKKFIGDPTETSLFDYLESKKMSVSKLKNSYERIVSAPFDSDRKLMSSINKVDKKTYIFVKGSPEELVKRCKLTVKNGELVKLTPKLSKDIINKEQEMAKKALRVMAFAYKEIKKVPKESEKVLDEEYDLVYVGLAGIIDPPRVDVKESVQKCLGAGIRPIMITGDSLVTACAIAKEVGIIHDDSEGLLGSELDKYDDDELVEVVKNYSVYARVTSLHKVRIVKAWQANGKVVAMTGDGVNDAPAIKDAHVGVGMGITGTEVTKSVADIVLLDDSFSTIVDACEEGRRIFANITNNVVYSLSSNFAELFAVLIGMITGHTILLPIHILFIDLVTDTIPSICLSFEKAENGIMDKKPRGINKPIFTPFIIATIAYSAIIETVFALAIYFGVLNFYGSDVAVTLSLLTVVIQEILFSISCRNLKQSVFKQGFFSNNAMNIGLAILIVIELLVFLTPLGKLINLTVVELPLLLGVLLFNIVGFILYETAKPLLTKLFSD